MSESNQIRGARFAADAMNINHTAHPLRFRESHREIVRLSTSLLSGQPFPPMCHSIQLADRKVSA
jgi:hypothetical protein